MKLVVDIGNSCLKWARLEAQDLGTQYRFFYCAETLIEQLSQAWSALPPPKQIWVASVAAPLILEQLTQWTQLHWQLTPIVVKTTDYAFGVTNGYQHPIQLGVDRWLALIGAYHLKLKTIQCIVDCGTAITIDMIDSSGNHQGGVIIPGLSTMRRLLSNNTHGIHHSYHDTVGTAFTLLAHDTQKGVDLGAMYAALGLIDYLLSRSEKSALILTGGDAPLLLDRIERPYYYIPELVLQGLAVAVNS